MSISQPELQLVFTPVQTQISAPTQGSRILDHNAVVEERIAGGEARSFRVTLQQSQYMRATVEQQGIDLKLLLQDPAGKLLIQMDSPNGRYGPETISIVAPTAGDYTLEVRSADKLSASGRYKIRVDEVRVATEEDRKYVEAEQTFLEGNTLYNQADRASLTAAREKYEQALDYWRKTKDAYGTAYAFCSLGMVMRQLGAITPSLTYFEEALSIWRESGNLEQQAFVLNEIGAVHRNIGKPSDSIPYYNEALELRTRAGNTWGQAQILSNMGLISARTGSFRNAIELFHKSLDLLQGSDERTLVVTVNNNLGGALDELGDTQNALDVYRQALEIVRDTQNLRLQAVLRNNIGKIMDIRGEFQEAKNEYESALELYRRVPDLNGEAVVTDNIGMLFAIRGDTQTGLEYFRSALSIRKQVNRPRETAYTFSNLGYAYSLAGDQSKALENLKESLRLRELAEDKQGVATTLSLIGQVYADSNQPQTALDSFQRALAIQKQLGNRRAQAVSLNKLGQAYFSTGNLTKASESYQNAFTLFKAVEDREGEALVLFGIAKVEQSTKQLEAARSHIDEAIADVESLRGSVTNQRLRLVYFTGKQDFYGLAIQIRMQLHELKPQDRNDVAAFYASERARARSLIDIIENSSSDIRNGIDASRLEELQLLKRNLHSRTESLIKAHVASRSDDAEFLSGQVKTLTSRYDHVLSEISKQNESHAALIHPTPTSLTAIQSLLDNNTVLLEYALGVERSYLWVITNASLASYQLPGAVEIEQHARQVYDLMSVPADSRQSSSANNGSVDRYWIEAQNLSQELLGPIADKLEDKRLLIVPDGDLQYLPFGALPAPRVTTGSNKATDKESVTAPLIVAHEIVSLPSASTLLALRRQIAGRKSFRKTVAVIADPVFEPEDSRMLKTNDPRKQKSRSSPVRTTINQTQLDTSERPTQSAARPALPRLLSAAREARDISALVSPDERLIATGFAANVKTVTNTNLSPYKIIHFATHAVVDDEHPELSGIALSRFNSNGQAVPNDFLLLRDIYNLRLPADLVVLSACKTALGKRIRGEGMIGLTRGFMYAGAARVVSSFWRADDEATAELMSSFYSHMLRDRMRPTASLRAAQIEMWKRTQYGSPYYWGAFSLQGEWR